MEQKSAQIAEYRKEISGILSELEVQFEQLGKVLARFASPKFIEAKEMQTRIKAIEVDVDTLDMKISEIQQAKDKSQAAREEIATIEQRLSSIDMEKNSLFSRIGVIAYEEYSAGSLGEEFSLLFTSVTHQNTELTKFQKALKENELRFVAAPFFEKMSLRIKRNRLKNEIQKLDSAREDLFRKAGKQISSSEYIKQVKSRNAIIISEDYKRISIESARLYEQMENRKSEGQKNEEFLLRAGVTGSIEKRVEELTKNRKLYYTNLQVLYIDLAHFMLDHPEELAKVEEVQEAANNLQHIHKLERKQKELENKIIQLEAKIRISELETIIKNDQDRVEHLNGQITMLTKQIQDIKETVSQNRKQIVNLKKIAGKEVE
jgi:peptidoglycan hydrolase CwlO-like protein